MVQRSCQITCLERRFVRPDWSFHGGATDRLSERFVAPLCWLQDVLAPLRFLRSTGIGEYG